MNDIVAEKLAQKVANLIEEVTEVNLLVRRLSPPQETINKIHERIQIIQTGTVETTEKMKQNVTATQKLGEQAKTLQEGQNKMAQALEEAVLSINYAANEMNRKSIGQQEDIALRMEKVSENLRALRSWVIIFAISTALLLFGYILKAIF